MQREHPPEFAIPPFAERLKREDTRIGVVRGRITHPLYDIAKQIHTGCNSGSSQRAKVN
jgi:hypothetical protein